MVSSAILVFLIISRGVKIAVVMCLLMISLMLAGSVCVVVIVRLI